MDTDSTDSSDSTAADHGSQPGTVVVEARTVRRRLGGYFWTSAAVSVVLITVALGVTRGPSIEHDLELDVVAALEDAGLDSVSVSANGRLVTANVPGGIDADEVKDVVSRVHGVSVVTAMPAYASYAEARACANLQERLDTATHGQRIPFLGSHVKPTLEGAAMLRDVAEILKSCRSAVVYVGGHTGPATRYGSTLSLDRARVLAQALSSQGIAEDRLQPRGYGDEFRLDGSGSDGTDSNERGSIMVRSQ